MKIKKANYRNELSAIDGSLYNPKYIANLSAMLYQENSKFGRNSIIKQGEDIGKFSIPYILERSSQPYKSYPTKEKISLKDYDSDLTDSIDLFETIKNRRSGRDYEDYNISMNEIYRLLHYSYGITGDAPINGINGTWSYRAVPSGGALYPLELYFYLNQSPNEKGIYHYRPDESSIELINKGDMIDSLSKILVAEPYVNIRKCSCIFFVTSIFERTLLKYGERGFRFILQEVGFVSQNISLICEALGLTSCMIGSYIDEEVNNKLLVDGTLETIQNVIIVGKGVKNGESCQIAL